MLKKLINRCIAGIACGCTLLTVILLIMNLASPDEIFPTIMRDYPRQVFCAILTSIVFWVLALVYENDKLSLSTQTLIHMGCGLTVYFLVGFYAHWIPIEAGIGIVLATLFFMLIISFGTWFCFYLYYRAQAKKMNERIHKLS